LDSLPGAALNIIWYCFSKATQKYNFSRADYGKEILCTVHLTHLGTLERHVQIKESS